jgi:hypothetical protein
VPDTSGFPLAVEAGLGRETRRRPYHPLQTLPASRSAAEIWRGGGNGKDLIDPPKGLDGHPALAPGNRNLDDRAAGTGTQAATALSDNTLKIVTSGVKEDQAT